MIVNKNNSKQAIVFADIGGSSALYNDVGNLQAKKSIDLILTATQNIISMHNGNIVKTIGDEVMSAFRNPDDAIKAAMVIQTQLNGILKQNYLTINIGIGFGEVIQEQRDRFGNTVNEAAFLTSLATSGQILITENCFQALTSATASYAREFDEVVFKGTSTLSRIFRIYWQNESKHGSETQLMTADIREGLLADTIEIRFRSRGYTIRVEETPFVIGRDESQSDLCVLGSEVSRKHCHINYSRGKFVLVDHSTNGCYLSSSSHESYYLRREALPLAGTMRLSLGLPLEKAGDNIIELCL